MREASVRTGRTRDGTPAAPDRLGDEHHHRDRRARLDEKVRLGYHPRRGGRYDSEVDRSPSPEPPIHIFHNKRYRTYRCCHSQNKQNIKNI